jgi:hypothetical protein
MYVGTVGVTRRLTRVGVLVPLLDWCFFLCFFAFEGCVAVVLAFFEGLLLPLNAPITTSTSTTATTTAPTAATRLDGPRRS